MQQLGRSRQVSDVRIGARALNGRLAIPERASGLVIFAHGSGSSRFSPRHIYVAERLEAAGLGTLLFDLLTEPEARDRRNVFDVRLLSQRVLDAIEWASKDANAAGLSIGLFGASTGAAAALMAAANAPQQVSAVVSRGGRPDLAGSALPSVRAPTLLIVGGSDYNVIELNEAALAALRCEKHLEIIPGATHLFEEPGALDAVVARAISWFRQYLMGRTLKAGVS